MLLILFHVRYHLLHFFQDWGRGVIVNVSLQQFKHIQSITWIIDEVREQNVEPVVDGNKVVPVLGSQAQSVLEVSKTFPREIIPFQRTQDIFVRKARTVQRDADAGREDGIHETPRIPDHYETVAAELLHGIAVVALIFKRTYAIGFAQSLFDHGARAHGAPEEFLAVFFRLCEIFLLRYYADAGHIGRNRNLPDPGVGNGQEVNIDVVEVRVPLGEDFAVVVAKPGVNGVLVENRILDFKLHLIAQEGVAAAGVHHHFGADVHFLRTHAETHQGLLGTEINRADFDAVINRRAQFVGVLQEHQIKLAAIHVVGVVFVDAGLLALVEPDVDVAIRGQALEVVNVRSLLVVSRPYRTVLVRELGSFHLG